MEDISRGDMICHDNTMKISDSVSVKFTKNQYFKGELSEAQLYMLSVGLQIKPVKIKYTDMLKVAAEKPIVYSVGQRCVLLKPDNEGIRIVGQGTIL